MKKFQEAKILRDYIEHCTKYTWAQPADKRMLKRRAELHPSSLPYCGLYHFHSLITEGEALLSEGDYYSDYYTGLGTLKHELMQRYLGWGKKIIGDWECRDCKHTRKFSFYKPCNKCGSPFMEYKELEIRFGENVEGHTDGLVFINGKYFVIDYKTCSSKALYFYRRAKSNGKESTMPYKKNVYQIRSYVPLLEAAFDIKVEGWILIYVSRDSSFKDYEIIGEYVNEKAKKKELAYIKQSDRHFSIAMEAYKKKKLKLILPLVEERPCQSHKHYKETMLGEWDKQKCPLGDSKVCFDETKLKKRLKKDFDAFINNKEKTNLPKGPVVFKPEKADKQML